MGEYERYINKHDHGLFGKYKCTTPWSFVCQYTLETTDQWGDPQRPIFLCSVVESATWEEAMQAMHKHLVRVGHEHGIYEDLPGTDPDCVVLYGDNDTKEYA